jgi:hypothetical protein
MQYNHNIHISLYPVVKRHSTPIVKIRSIINTNFFSRAHSHNMQYLRLVQDLYILLQNMVKNK